MHNILQILPRPLSAGATIGIAAPGGCIRDKELFARGIRILHEWGYRTKFPRSLWKGCGYLADSDTERAEEFLRLWHDPDVDAIMAARGGYGCLRIAQGIDWESLAQCPKLLLGFSDISCFHHCLNSYSGIPSLHAPVVTSLPGSSTESLRSLRETLHYGIHLWQHKGSVDPVRKGDDVSGISAGGNLTTLVSTLGTQLQPDWTGKIVFLEDTGEPAYRVDRLFTQLSLAGLFRNISALILGDFSHGLQLDRNGEYSHLESVTARALELTPEDIPVWNNFPIGHGSANTTVPLGIPLLLKADSLSLQICREWGER